MVREQIIKKYITDIILTIIVVGALTWFWFGPCKNRVRIKESLEASNVAFNTKIETEGFGYLDISNDKLAKKLVVTNNTAKQREIFITFNSAKNNYINYIITDNEGNESSVRTLSLDGYILENKIEKGETKEYTITLWTDNNTNLGGNLELLLNTSLT